MIETENLRLIMCELVHFEAMVNGQKQLEQMLDVSVADEWLSFPEAVPYVSEYVKANLDAPGWGMYLFVHAKDNVLIGSGGFKGKGDEAGVVEIGYGVAPGYRKRGLATEAAQGLVDYAFSHPHIKRVDAHTLAERNASTRVLEKVGMRHIGTVHDPEDGEIWHWSLRKEDYRKA